MLRLIPVARETNSGEVPGPEDGRPTHARAQYGYTRNRGGRGPQRQYGPCCERRTSNRQRQEGCGRRETLRLRREEKALEGRTP